MMPTQRQPYLQAFADSLPDGIRKSESPDRDAKFSFKLGSADSLDALLEQAIKKVPKETVEWILRRLTAEKFSDFDISDDGASIWATTHVVWRGGIRPGEVIWRTGDVATVAESASDSWKVFVRYGSSLGSENAALRWPACEWVLGNVSVDDLNTILRFHVLQTDDGLRETFRDSISTAVHVHSIAVEKIWQRIFIEDSYLVSGESRYELTNEARSSYDLAQLFEPMLEDQLGKQFPLHPAFSEVLGTNEVSRVTEHLFSGGATDGADAQKVAKTFALPLGLVIEQDGVLSPQTPEGLARIPVVQQVIQAADPDSKDVIPLDELSRRTSEAPFGLTLEAQHLVLAALVAHRQFEFVTSSGNRINHRSLDLQIIWEDIVGIARPSDEGYSGDRLLNWAALLTGDASLTSLRMLQADLRLIEALSAWLNDWQKARILARFDGLPDEKLNSRLWRVAANVKKTFGVIAESIDGLMQDAKSIDKCLHTIAEVFADSDDEFESKRKDLADLTKCIEKLAERDQIAAYLAFCEPTGDAALEELRCSLMHEVNTNRFQGETIAETEFKERWDEFRARYTEFYAKRHNAAAEGSNRAKLDEFMATDRWMAFAELSAIPWFGRHDMELAMETVRKLRVPECNADVPTILTGQPFCSCSFSFGQRTDTSGLVMELEHKVAKGMEYFRQKLLTDRWAITSALNEIDEAGTESKVSALVPSLETSNDFPRLTIAEIHQLEAATKRLSRANPIHSDRRRPGEPLLQLDQDDLRALSDELDLLSNS